MKRRGGLLLLVLFDKLVRKKKNHRIAVTWKQKQTRNYLRGGGELPLCHTAIQFSLCNRVFRRWLQDPRGLRSRQSRRRQSEATWWVALEPDETNDLCQRWQISEEFSPKAKKETNSLFVDIYTYMYLFSKSSVKECASYPIARLFFSESKIKGISISR